MEIQWELQKQLKLTTQVQDLMQSAKLKSETSLSKKLESS